MKKFTVMTLLIALVAGFAFAGLSTYSKSSAGIAFNSVMKNLSSVDVDGSFTFGAKTDKVDVNAKAVLSYTDIGDDYDSESEFRAPTYVKVKGDTLTFVPSINFAYKDANLNIDASASWKNVRNNESNGLFGMKGGATKTNTVTLTAGAKYAQNVKNSANIVKLEGKETVLATGRKNGTSTTAVSATYFVPKAGATATAALADTFKDYTFKASATGSFSFKEDTARYAEHSAVKSASAELEYVRYDAKDNNVKFALNGSATNAASFDKDTDVYINNLTTINAGASVVGTYSEVKGLNGLDNFKVVATGSLSTSFAKEVSGKTTNGALSVVTTVPRLIPVEMIANASYNLPATFTVAYNYAKGEKVTTDSKIAHTVTFSIETHPVYVEFAKEIEVLGQKLDSFDSYISYGNGATFDAKINKDNKDITTYSFGAGVAVAFDNADLALDFAKTETKPYEVTMSYKTSY